MLVVDLMHEFELSVWKALFIHLLRILMSISPGLLHELDRRYVNLSSIISCANICLILATGKCQPLLEIQSENLGLTRLS